MPVDEVLADRVREMLASTTDHVFEKKMFGGICFMVNDKMCVAVTKERLMVRVGTDAYETALEQDGCRPMDFSGREMKGFVYVEDEGINSKKKLHYWVSLALEYNKVAPIAKKKKKK